MTAARDIRALALRHLGAMPTRHGEAWALARDRVAVFLDNAQDDGWDRREAAAALVRLCELPRATLAQDGIWATIDHTDVTDARDRGDLPALLQYLTAGTSTRLSDDYDRIAHVVRTVLDAVEIAGPWR